MKKLEELVNIEWVNKALDYAGEGRRNSIKPDLLANEINKRFKSALAAQPAPGAPDSPDNYCEHGLPKAANECELCPPAAPEVDLVRNQNWVKDQALLIINALWDKTLDHDEDGNLWQDVMKAEAIVVSKLNKMLTEAHTRWLPAHDAKVQAKTVDLAVDHIQIGGCGTCELCKVVERVRNEALKKAAKWFEEHPGTYAAEFIAENLRALAEKEQP